MGKIPSALYSGKKQRADAAFPLLYGKRKNVIASAELPEKLLLGIDGMADVGFPDQGQIP